MSNHLKDAASPYLLQHAENPVDWYPWGEEAFEKARREDKPVFLSVGYSTCHWCHVMARESFESGAIAAILNRAFVSIKVDREERPDIDSVYMAVCQAFTGSGGWPMSIFMTWDKKPFFAGTYFPPEPGGGMPGFAELLTAVETRWKNGRAGLLQAAEQVVAALKKAAGAAPEKPTRALERRAFEQFSESFDSAYGGFGQAPKFPAAHNLLFLLLYADRRQEPHGLEMAEKTLEQLRRGGIFDQIGGGFSRYSTDRQFLAPHFEKMLYDNALLIAAYCAAYHATGKGLYLCAAEETAAYIQRDMTDAAGGFFSAQDADSGGVEGGFYTFSRKEVLAVLGQETGGRFAQAFDITEQGNFEGRNIPNLLKNAEVPTDFVRERERLRIYREKRARLHLDDKLLTAWNAMTIAALALLYRTSGAEKYLRMALRAQRFIDENLREGPQLYTGFRRGKRFGPGFLDDYAYEAAALIELYSSTLAPGYLDRAEQLCREAVSRFADNERGGFFLSEGGELFMKPKETYDGAIPSGNAMMAYDFVRLYQLTEREDYRARAEAQLDFLAGEAGAYPAGHAMFLLAKLLYDEPPKRVTFVWRDPAELEKARQKLPFFSNVTAARESPAHPLLHGRATCYVCQGRVCRPPTNELDL